MKVIGKFGCLRIHVDSHCGQLLLRRVLEAPPDLAEQLAQVFVAAFVDGPRLANLLRGLNLARLADLDLPPTVQ